MVTAFPSDFYIEFNGTILNTKAYNVDSFLPGTPAKRGENLSIPFLDGKRFVEKRFDERVITLNMWVRGVDTSGKVPAGKTPKQVLEENVETLKALFASPIGQVSFKYMMKDGTTYRKAMVEVANVIEFERMGSTAKFSVDLVLADPFFYAESYTSDKKNLTVTPYSWTHNNPGSAIAKKMEIILTGSLQEPKIENTTAGVWLQYNGTIASGETVTIDTKNFTIMKGTENMIAGMTHYGSQEWFMLYSGANSMKVTCNGTPDGSVELKYYAPYF